MFAAGKTAIIKNNDANYVEDVFSTYLYTGTGSTQRINNGIQLGASIGGSVNFQNSDSQIYAPQSTTLDLGSGNWTLEAWIFPTVFNNFHRIFSKQSGGDFFFFRLSSTGSLIFQISTGSYTLTASSNPTLSAWSHVAVVRNGNTISMYINGTSVGSSAYSSTPVAISAPLSVSGYNIDGAIAETFKGYISNARFVKGTAVYTTNFTPSTSPLTAISNTVLLTAQTPNPFIDNSANAFPLTVNNAVAAIYSGPFGTDIVNSKGGMVWTKNRSNAISNIIVDTVRGGTNALITDSTAANSPDTGFHISGFNSDGYSLQGAGTGDNTSGNTYVSWTFRKQPKFFDIRSVSHTNGVADTVDFSDLGTIGCIIFKDTGTSNWIVWHRTFTGSDKIVLNLTDPIFTSTAFSVSGTTVTISAAATTGTKLMYAFAHNAGGFGTTGTDNVVSCGTFTTDAGGNATVNPGFEPQWILQKQSNSTGNWFISDVMRGMTVGTVANLLRPNLSSVESAGGTITPTATGFTVSGYPGLGTYIYIAIRRGPMKVPTLGTSVFGLTLKNSYLANEIVVTSFPPDMSINKATALILDNYSASRLTGGWLSTNSNAAEASATWKWDGVAGQGYATPSYTGTPIYWSFRRAPGFFDVVAGKYFNGNLAHNLGVVPELVIAKQRDSVNGWYVWTTGFTTSQYLGLSSSSAIGSSLVWDTMTSTQIGLQNLLPSNTGVYYLFATCPGVSKVGSYTGTGALQTIACGFTSGARFVLIKRTDSTGDWYVWDSARGITSGTDPYLLLNSTAAEVTGTNYVDTDTTGFKVTVAAPAALNAVGGTYIFLAIA